MAKPSTTSTRLTAPRGAMGAGRGPGPMGGMGIPTEKSLNFGPSAKRLMARLRPERNRLIAVVILAVASVTLSVLGPWMLGKATNIIFDGAISAKMPAGLTKDMIIKGLKAQGKDQLAAMLQGLDLHPGQGIDFKALAAVLIAVLAIYAGAFLFGVIQARVLNVSVQKVIFKLRQETEAKLHRLPLAYFDAMQRGVTVEQVRHAVKLAQRHGIQVGMFLMWGYEGEEFDDIAATVEHVAGRISQTIVIASGDIDEAELIRRRSSAQLDVQSSRRSL